MDAITEVELPPDWRKLLTPDREAKKAARAETLARLKQALAAAEAKLRKARRNAKRQKRAFLAGEKAKADELVLTTGWSAILNHYNCPNCRC